MPPAIRPVSRPQVYIKYCISVNGESVDQVAEGGERNDGWTTDRARGNARDIKLEGGHMGKTVTTKYDVAEHLRSPEEMAAYLEACFEEAGDDAAFITKALGDIARARGMAQVARDAGLSRESLYKALSGKRSPGFVPF